MSVRNDRPPNQNGTLGAPLRYPQAAHRVVTIVAARLALNLFQTLSTWFIRPATRPAIQGPDPRDEGAVVLDLRPARYERVRVPQEDGTIEIGVRQVARERHPCARVVATDEQLRVEGVPHPVGNGEPYLRIDPLPAGENLRPGDQFALVGTFKPRGSDECAGIVLLHSVPEPRREEST
jgi:hypothetical protein